MGLTSGVRGDIENRLTGSREISKSEKERLERELSARAAIEKLLRGVVGAIRGIHGANNSTVVGFRRANMAALLWRYFIDMQEGLQQVAHVLKPKSRAFLVVGDSRTNAGGKWVVIETCKHIETIGTAVGLKPIRTIAINVTKESYKHIKNAITENQVLVFEKS
jgi:site-specific DNA-methyltransferase (cytosine-N4-specific)